MKFSLCFCLLVGFFGLGMRAVAHEKSLGESQTFVLEERFGVTHPEQLLYFDVQGKIDPANAQLLDENGQAVPFQISRTGQLILKTGLAANQKHSWMLVSRPPKQKPEPQVTVTEASGYYEISNGLTGIRIPSGEGLSDGTPAPIQGIQLRDGSWTAVGPNWMDSPALSMKLTFEENGPLLVRVKIAYRYFRKGVHGKLMPKGIPQGEGIYSQTVEVQAGQPSLLFEEESEVDLSYRVNITEGLFPDQARYSGHLSSSVKAGRTPDGRVYSSMQNVGNEKKDAIVDLNPNMKDRWSGATYPFLSFWDPWSKDTGVYWQLYSTKGKSGNLLGIFSGRASRLLDPALSGVAVDLWNPNKNVSDRKNGTESPASDFEVGLRVKFNRLSPTQKHSARIRFQWGLFVGEVTKDLFAEDQVQSIGKQMNLHGGIDLNFVKDLKLEYPDLPQGYGNLYMSSNFSPPELTEELARKDYAGVVDFAKNYLDVLVNGKGIYNAKTVYFMVCLRISPQMQKMDKLLSSSFLSDEQRLKLKAISVLYASLLWNNDLVPMFEGTGMNLGPYNMVSMWRGTRYAYTAFVAPNPQFAERVKGVRDDTFDLMCDFVSKQGAGSACPWYVHTANTPLISLIQQFKMLGEGDSFLNEARLKRHAEFLLQLQTPPDPRFGGVRKLIALGQGAVAGSWLLGQLATLYAEKDPELSSRLMGAWRQSGNPHSQFFGDSRFRINKELPASPLALKSDDFEGYCSVMRFQSDTPTESALWFINGSTYFDHRQADQGDVMIHALGSPLAENWGSYSFPITSSPRMQNVAIPADSLQGRWDVDEVPFSEPGDMSAIMPWGRESTSFPMLAFIESVRDRAVFSARKDYEWERTVTAINVDPQRPVFIVDDRIKAKSSGTSEVITTWNMVAEGSVQTPVGSINPMQRTYDERKNLKEHPSSSDVRNLAPGLNRFQFVGQHGINWDLYRIAPEGSQFALGNWGYAVASTPLMEEYLKTWKKPFEWRQHILSFKGGGVHRTLILPRLKEDIKPPANVSDDNGDIRIQSEEGLLVVARDSYASYESKSKKMLASYKDDRVEAAGFVLEGGPTEVILVGGKASVTVAGKKGMRKILLPKGDWSAKDSSWRQKSLNEWELDYRGETPETFEFVKK